MTNKVQQFDTDCIELEQKQPLYDGFFKLFKYRFRHKLFAGGWSRIVEREILERGHAVAVLPYDPKAECFILIEQLRIGAMATSEQPWLLECIAGMIAEGEAPEDVCRREAEEEAGVQLGRMHKALSYLSSPGGTTERLHIYIAEVDSEGAGGIFGLDHEDEDILVHRVPEAEGMSWLQQGKIDNAATVIAMQWFALNKNQIINEWCSDK